MGAAAVVAVATADVDSVTSAVVMHWLVFNVIWVVVIVWGLHLRLCYQVCITISYV